MGIETIMIKRKSIELSSPFGPKTISVYEGELTDFNQPVSLLTVSAFRHNYSPDKGTLIGALSSEAGISVKKLSVKPVVDIRDFCGCWISKELPKTEKNQYFERIGCVEMSPLWSRRKIRPLSIIQSYFHVLELLPQNGISVQKVMMPLLGSGKQGYDPKLIAVPLINETLHYLKRSEYTDEIIFIDRGKKKTDILVNALESSYTLFRETQKRESEPENKTKRVFISYSSIDHQVADIMCKALEAKGISVWYAPRDIKSGSYAQAIVSAIHECTHFVIIISKNSMQSQHVLNEIDMAFNGLKDGVVLLPFRVDSENLKDEFSYYLSRQQWTEAQNPPLQARIEEFIDKTIL